MIEVHGPYLNRGEHACYCCTSRHKFQQSSSQKLPDHIPTKRVTYLFRYPNDAFRLAWYMLSDSEVVLTAQTQELSASH